MAAQAEAVQAEAVQRVRIALSDAAITMKVRHRRVYDLALEGRLGPVERLGGRLFVTSEGVQAFIRERDQAP